jgi:DNA-directed RNA polymerase specialized sigma24 family protein
MTTYGVTVTRDSGTWAAVVDGLPPHVIGAIDVEHFADLRSEVRDLIAALTETDLDSFGLTWRVIIEGHDVTAEVLALGDAEAALDDALTAREGARQEALKALAGAGLSQAAIGDVLGLSHQRVHQLLKAS